MKIFRRIFLIATCYLFFHPSYAQTDTVRIKTSAICEQCKERIENDLSFEKEIKKSYLDLKTDIITVIYNSKKTDEQKIREAIARIGYDADTLKADTKAYSKLPSCCRHEQDSLHGK